LDSTRKTFGPGKNMSDQKPVRPWDLLNKNKARSPEELQQYRMSICKSCEFFVSFTQQCKKCGCIMPAKTRLADAFCPVHKWESVKEEQ
jgi:hypothetical protein